MYRSFRTILVLLLSLSMAWLPMQSVAGMSDGSPRDGLPQDGAPQMQQSVHCHSGMAMDDTDTAGDVAMDSTDGSMNKTAHSCCCDGCDSNCDSGCMQGGNMAMLSADSRLAVDKHHAFQVSVSFLLKGLTYTPPIPPPLV